MFETGGHAPFARGAWPGGVAVLWGTRFFRWRFDKLAYTCHLLSMPRALFPDRRLDDAQLHVSPPPATNHLPAHEEKTERALKMKNTAEHCHGLAEQCRSGAKGRKNAVQEVSAKNHQLTLPKNAMQGMGSLEANP